MTSEIRTLFDNQTDIYPKTVGSAVVLSSGKTVEDLADRSNKNQIKLNSNEPMRVVVAEWEAEHPQEEVNE